MEVTKLVRDCVNANILGSYAEVFNKVMMPAGEKEAVAATAAMLTTLPRFAINAMLMKNSEKTAMKEVFDALGDAGEKTRKEWKC